MPWSRDVPLRVMSLLVSHDALVEVEAELAESTRTE
jgi:hypothetical protein